MRRHGFYTSRATNTRLQQAHDVVNIVAPLFARGTEEIP